MTTLQSAVKPLVDGTPVYRTAEIRRIESLAAGQIDPPDLMERAGLAAGLLARALVGGTGGRVAVIAGPGNNGGDAFVVARHLKEAWFEVSLTFAGDASRLAPDAAAAYAAWQAAGGEITADVPAGRDFSLVVDGLFGIGLQRDLTDRYAELCGWINESSAPVLALDVPSGLESDTGRVLGCAVRASHTITFIGLKPGLLTLDGPDYCGTLHIAPLDLDAPALVRPSGRVLAHEILQSALPRRRRNSHKGDHGSAAIIGGAPGMAGAALLAGRAALKLGAGRVYLGFTGGAGPAVDPLQPELMLRRTEEVLELDHLTSLGVGPGLGLSPDAQSHVRSALASKSPLVLDADALNLIAQNESLRSLLAARNAPTILTPHPAEAARLLGSSTAEIQADRLGAALKLAATYSCGVVLKGAGSICAWPDGRWAINTSGNPGMASAGMGDVLTGILAALLAQGARAEAALPAAVYLHGAAADALVHASVGPVGLTASEVIDAARDLMNSRHRTDR